MGKRAIPILPSSFFSCGCIFPFGKDKVLVGWGERNWLERPKKNGLHFYSPGFFLTESAPFFQHETMVEIAMDDLSEAFFPPSQTLFDSDWEWEGESSFAEAIEESQRLFASKELKKTVPYLFLKRRKGIDAQELRHLLGSAVQYVQSHPAFLYGFWDERSGLVGVTPETLFNWKGKRLETVALAGTAPIATDSEELLADPKEREEHAIVVHALTEALSLFGKVEQEALRTVPLGVLQHLCTPMHVDLQKRPSFTKLVSHIHPTPALGAYPKSRGALWLERYAEKMPRGRFGAPIGWVDPSNEEGACYVAIRGLNWDRDQTRIVVGCGVTEKSDYLKERKEVALKGEAIRRIFRI